MATQQEKIAAAEAALLAFDGTKDTAEAARAVALIDSQLALLPVPEVVPPPQDDAVSAVAMRLKHDDPGVQAAIDAWDAEGRRLLGLVMQGETA